MVVTYGCSKMRYTHICLSVCLYTCCLPISLSICSIACISMSACNLPNHLHLAEALGAKPGDEAAHVKKLFSLWQILQDFYGCNLQVQQNRIHAFVCIFVHLSVCLVVPFPICLCLLLAIYLFLHLHIYLSLCLSLSVLNSILSLSLNILVEFFFVCMSY